MSKLSKRAKGPAGKRHSVGRIMPRAPRSQKVAESAPLEYPLLAGAAVSTGGWHAPGLWGLAKYSGHCMDGLICGHYACSHPQLTSSEGSLP